MGQIKKQIVCGETTLSNIFFSTQVVIKYEEQVGRKVEFDYTFDYISSIQVVNELVC